MLESKWTLFALVCAGALSACRIPATAPPPEVPLTFEQPLCTGGRPARCLEPARVERWLTDPSLRIIDTQGAHRGIQEATVLTLQTMREGRPIVFRAKWRPQSAAIANYSEPRVAIATHALQKRLVSSVRYVIPPTVGHCFELSHYRATVQEDAKPTGEGTACVWGSLSYWLESVRQLDEIEDEDWYEHDEAFDRGLYGRSPVYRDAVATINLITYLARNGDAHSNQFLIRPNPNDPHVYLVDNSMGFGARINSELAGTAGDWTTLLVDLPEDGLKRVLSWQDADYDALRSIERYELREGQLVRSRRPLPIGQRIPHQADGLTMLDGVLHVGLNDVELEALRARVEELRMLAGRGQLRIVRACRP